MRKRILSVTLSVIFIWLVLSIYFYGQHLLVIKEYPLYARAETDDALIVLRNVVAYNHKRNYHPFDQSPWYWKAALRIKNSRIQRAFISTCFFYSRPYIFDPDKRTVKLQGMIVSKNAAPEQNVSLFEDNPFEVRLYGDFDVSLTGGTGGMNEDSNITYFQLVGDEVMLNNHYTFKAVIKDSLTGELIKELPFRPRWRYKIYNYWQRKPDDYNFRPMFTMNRFINVVQQENHGAAATYLYFKRREQFPWDNLDPEQLASAVVGREYYVGEYLDMKNVFAVDIEFHEPDRQTLSRGEPYATQTIFFIDALGQWKIIDVTPIRNAGEV